MFLVADANVSVSGRTSTSIGYPLLVRWQLTSNMFSLFVCLVCASHSTPSSEIALTFARRPNQSDPKPVPSSCMVPVPCVLQEVEHTHERRRKCAQALGRRRNHQSRKRLILTFEDTDARSRTGTRTCTNAQKHRGTTFHRFQSTAYLPNTHVDHVALTGM